VVAQMADEVVVMYLGRVVESGSVRAILKKPRHPYTIGLLESVAQLTRSASVCRAFAAPCRP
jgi:ABC-type dipeptide/oligopeptide/nickel transport system ATPase component